jgi:hypothetical protein
MKASTFDPLRAPLAMAFALLAPSTATAESKGSSIESVIASLLPKRWTVETKDLPAGVRGVVLGPPSAAGRAVIMLTELDAAADASELMTERSRALLAERLGGARIVQPSIAGTTEVSKSAPREREIRYLVASGKPSYLLTIVAPRAIFDEAYALVVELATQLRRSTSRG